MSALIAASRAGVKKHTSIPQEDIFNIRLARLIARQFGARDRDCLRLIQAEGNSGLLASRRRALAAAQRHFSAGQALLNEGEMTPRARKLAMSILFAQKAYGLYARGDFSSATKLLRAAFASDLALEVDATFSLLAMHRIQLLNNLMRVEWRRGRWRQAVLLGVQLLQYLQAPDAKTLRALASPWSRGWNGRLAKIPAGLVAKMHAQIAAETAAIFEGALAAASASQIKTTLSRAGRLASAETQIGRWLDFQKAQFGELVDTRCLAASALLQLGSVPSAPLWLSVAEHMQTLLTAAAAAVSSARASSIDTPHVRP